MPDGTRAMRSTKATDKSKALQIAIGWERAARMRATKDQAQRVLADIVKAVSGEDFEQTLLHGFLDRWVAGKAREVTADTLIKYKQTVKDLKLGIPAHQLMNDVTIGALVDVRDAIAARTSVANANQSRKMIRSIWTAAFNDGRISENVSMKLGALNPKKEREERPSRRPFKIGEVEACLDQIEPEDEWFGMTLFGTYTGQRLGDVARAHTSQIRDGIWKFKSRKTGIEMQIGLAMPVLQWLKKHSPKDGFIFPKAAATPRTGTLSNRFYTIMSHAGLVPHRRHRKKKVAEIADGKRRLVELGFHCFRHTTQTWLMEAGASRELAMAHIGHEDETVSEGYTHISVGALKPFVEKLPTVRTKKLA